jgi:hypothetical protein
MTARASTTQLEPWNRVTALAVAALLLAGGLSVSACSPGLNTSGDPASRAAPLKKDGSRSYEFEQDDYDTADQVSPEVKDYCADAVSEAQRLGCESHVQPEDIP